jgi:hypothetical protein
VKKEKVEFLSILLSGRSLDSMTAPELDIDLTNDSETAKAHYQDMLIDLLEIFHLRRISLGEC